MARPFRELLRAALDARPDLTTAELGRIVGAARRPPARPKVVEKALLNALAAQPREEGARPREMGERLFGEIVDALGLEVTLVPKGKPRHE